jgi:hypothetical protein
MDARTREVGGTIVAMNFEQHLVILNNVRLS